jgi:D-alanyl-D-alanine carboxypeptidase
MYFKPGQKLTLDSALKILMVKSANDIAVAVAEAVGGTQEAFVVKMNAEGDQARHDGFAFRQSERIAGQGPVYDGARPRDPVGGAAPRFSAICRLFLAGRDHQQGKNVPSINMLIGRFAGADGMKTGFICASGFNQIGSATRNGRTLVSVVLGTDSLAARADASADLLQKGFTTQFPGTDTLGSLKPYGPGQDQVADITAEICSAKGAKVRSETRDEVGRMKIHSPYIHEMDHEPNFSYAGLIPGQNEPQPDKLATPRSAQARYRQRSDPDAAPGRRSKVHLT